MADSLSVFSKSIRERLLRPLIWLKQLHSLGRAFGSQPNADGWPREPTRVSPIPLAPVRSTVLISSGGLRSSLEPAADSCSVCAFVPADAGAPAVDAHRDFPDSVPRFAAKTRIPAELVTCEHTCDSR